MVLTGVYIIVIVSDWQLGDNYELTSQKYYTLRLPPERLREPGTGGLVGTRHPEFYSDCKKTTMRNIKQFYELNVL